jgi:hypothetical protein
MMSLLGETNGFLPGISPQSRLTPEELVIHGPIRSAPVGLVILGDRIGTSEKVR